jgi:uncharacterized membrane protein
MSKTIDDGKPCAVLSYLIVGIIWFFADKTQRKNTFAKFHVKQAIIFIIALLVVNIGVALFSIISKVFSSIGGYILHALLAILWIISIIYTAEGKEKEMPVIGVFAKKLDF